MILIPLRSEEELPNSPYATLATVAANVLVALLLGFSPDALVLRYDEPNPPAWVTSAFAHAGWAHLLGNLIFLLAFGMVTEGLLGWRKFAVFYLGLALVQGALEQALFFGSGGGSLGASGCITGLVAAAALWAPERRLRVFVWWWRYVDTRPVAIWMLAGYWIGWDVVYFFLDGFALGTPLLHLLGAGVGFAAALLMLRKGWVDCDGRDWLSLRRGWDKPEVYPELERPQPSELARSFVQWMLPAAAGVLVAASMLVLMTTDWSGGAVVGRAVAALGLLASGGAAFWYWQTH